MNLLKVIKTIGSDISRLKSSINSRSLNVGDFDVDNTGSTDVTAKLNEIFDKAHKEGYLEVVFPNGTYKIENQVKIFCPEDMSHSLVVRTESTYGATILCDNTDAFSGEPIGFAMTRSTPENSDSDIVNAYNITINGFAFKVRDQDVDGNNFKFISTDSKFSNLLITNIKLVNLRMTNTKDGYGNNIDLLAQCNNLTIDSVEVNYGMYAIYLECNNGVNNNISNVISNNCSYALSSYSYADWESITIHYDDDFNISSGTTASFCANKISNFKLTGRWSLGQNLLSITVGDKPEISNVALDITLDHNELLSNNPSSFIYLQSASNAKLEVKVSNLNFEKFSQNFINWLNIGIKFSWIHSPLLAISPNNIYETSGLELFKNLGSVDEYSSKGFLNRKYETKAEDSAKTRIYLGYDRTIREVDIASEDELADNEGSAIFFGANGVPYKDFKDYDYSNYSAGVAGDVFLESKPKDSGHFGYVSTYRYTTRTKYLSKDDKPISITNHGDRTVTLGFNKFPVWTNGTLKDTQITVGSKINILGKGEFEIIGTDVEAKTLKCRIADNLNANVISTLADLSMEIYFIPDKPVNTMGVMTYEAIPIIHSGPTEKRPTEHLVVGQQYFDTTLGLPIFWNGTKWIANNVDIDAKLADYVRKDSIVATDVNSTPAFLGQVAISDKQIYIAVSLDDGSAGWNRVDGQPTDTL